MKFDFSNEAKVGLFVALALAIIAYITIQVSDLSLTPQGTYTVYAMVRNAEGVTPKTPVQVAGIPVGVVQSIDLMSNREARIAMRIKKGVQLSKDVELQVKTRGVLGDTYLEIVPGNPDTGLLENKQFIEKVETQGNFQDLYGGAEHVTKNLEEITDALKEYTVSDRSHMAQILKNMDSLTSNMATFTNNNLGNMDTIVANLRSLTQDLKNLSQNSSGDVQEAIKRISELTDKVNRGQGTIGQLVNEPTTIEKTNEVLDNISDLTRSYSAFQMQVGYHMEYLGQTGDVKNYVSLKLQPRPDKFFLFEVNNDPHPPGHLSTSTTTVTANGQTTVITDDHEDFNKTRFSAEFGKKFDDFTLRGGLIESTGGVGVDYDKGPVGVHFSAFDFASQNNNPHLKLVTQLNITPSIYIMGGMDNIIARQNAPNWLLGAGIRLTDEDVKSFIGGAVGALAR